MLRYELSHWEWESFFSHLDVVVVGSGIVGLSAAIHLKEQAPTLSILVLDRGPLPIGASTRNAGFACFGSLSELLDDARHSSREDILALVALRYQGLQRLRQRYGDQALGYEALGGYEVFRTSEAATYQACRAAMDRWNADLQELTQLQPTAGPHGLKYGTATFVAADERIPQTGMQGVAHLLLNRAEGQLHTGKLMHTLLARAQALGIRCLGGITIKNMQENGAQVVLETAAGWEFAAARVLVTTNGFAPHLLPTLPVQPARNQVLITTPLPGLTLRGCFHYDKGYVYFRNVGDRVLIGGARNLDLAGETTDELVSHPAIRKHLEHLLRTVVLPNQDVTIERAWSGIMGVGKHKKPIIETVGQRTVAAVRLGGMGVAIGTQVGEQAAELVLQL